jgi:hypothetical protein
MGDLDLKPLFLKILFQMKNPPSPKRRADKVTKTTIIVLFFLEPSPLEAVGILVEKRIVIKAY